MPPPNMSAEAKPSRAVSNSASSLFRSADIEGLLGAGKYSASIPHLKHFELVWYFFFFFFFLFIIRLSEWNRIGEILLRCACFRQKPLVVVTAEIFRCAKRRHAYGAMTISLLLDESSTLEIILRLLGGDQVGRRSADDPGGRAHQLHRRRGRRTDPSPRG